MNQYKCIQLWHPEGANEHAAVGYVVVYGVLAGMSSKGMSVHEANLETVCFIIFTLYFFYIFL